MNTTDEFTVPEAASDLKVSEETVRRNIRSKRLKAMHGETQWFIPRDVLLVWSLATVAIPKPAKYDKCSRECRHIHRHSRESGNPKAIGSKCVFASYRIPDSRFRGNDGIRRLETDILELRQRRHPLDAWS